MILFTKAHYHITLQGVTAEEAKVAAKLIKGKVTEIDLILNCGDRKERMLTKHQSDPFDQTAMMLDVKTLQENNFSIERYKFESEIDVESFLANPYAFKLNDFNFYGRYVEIHIFVPEIVAKKDYDGFVFSRNSKNQGYFYNGRARSLTQLSTLIDSFCLLRKGLEGLGLTYKTNYSIHLEIAMIDSNPSQDSDWEDQASSAKVSYKDSESLPVTLPLVRLIEDALPDKDGIFCYENKRHGGKVDVKVIGIDTDNPSMVSLTTFKLLDIAEFVKSGFRILKAYR